MDQLAIYGFCLDRNRRISVGAASPLPSYKKRLGRLGTCNFCDHRKFAVIEGSKLVTGTEEPSSIETERGDDVVILIDVKPRLELTESRPVAQA